MIIIKNTGSGWPIRSFLKSIVQSREAHRGNPKLYATFTGNRRQATSIALTFQYKTKGWRKFGTKEFDGWLYGNFDHIRYVVWIF